MKKIAIVLFLLLLCVPSRADVFVLINSETLEVQDISVRNDAFVEEGFEKIILKGKISDYALDEKAQNYKFIDKKFIYNSEKINAEYQAIQDAKTLREEMDLINKKVKEMAFDALEEDGVKLKIKKEDIK